METSNALLAAIDALLITPYRWPADPCLGWWLGTLLLSLWCAALGELSAALAVRVNRSAIREAFSEASNRHDQSLYALRTGDRVAYKGINALANEAYGKAFFLQITVAAAVLWPVPLAMAWLRLRFADLRFQLPFSLPGLGDKVSALFVYILLYIFSRILLHRLRVFRQYRMGKERGKRRP